MIEQSIQLRHWRHEILDLAGQPDWSERSALSVLANSVEYLNARLLARLERSATLLEIGCGSYSLLKNEIRPRSRWEGIDVIDCDRKGRPSVATRRASVEDIPWPDGSFDYVVSNQSIEHWHEYGVALDRGLSEIGRVLKDGGTAVINFPIHLHGHRMFLSGDFAEIDANFTKVGFRIESRTAVIRSTAPVYRGWRKCGFPDFLVNALPHHESMSYVVEYLARKKGCSTISGEVARAAGEPRQANLLQRHIHYGVRYVAWKLCTRLVRIDRRR